MADLPLPPAQTQLHPRPLSPFVTIFHWPITMATSIVHRVTGVGLTGGAIVLVWWLYAISGGMETYHFFYTAASHPVGQICLYGFAWAYAYHFFNGIRHLAWDFGYGFRKETADVTGIVVAALSLLCVASIFAIVHFGYAGYYR